MLPRSRLVNKVNHRSRKPVLELLTVIDVGMSLRKDKKTFNGTVPLVFTNVICPHPCFGLPGRLHPEASFPICCKCTWHPCETTLWTLVTRLITAPTKRETSVFGVLDGAMYKWCNKMQYNCQMEHSRETCTSQANALMDVGLERLYMSDLRLCHWCISQLHWGNHLWIVKIWKIVARAVCTVCLVGL